MGFIIDQEKINQMSLPELKAAQYDNIVLMESLNVLLKHFDSQIKLKEQAENDTISKVVKTVKK